MNTELNEAANAADGLVLLHASELNTFSPTLTLGRGWPTEIKVKVGDADKSFPITYLDKDLIEDGSYVDPKSGRSLPAPIEQLKDWVDKFHRMQAAGIELSIPCDHRTGSRDNLGFVKDAQLVDVPGSPRKRLRLTHALIGEDAALIAIRNRASLGINPNYVDGKGKKWGSTIVHSAITPDPVIFGMGEFTPTSLSRTPADESKQVNATVFLLSNTPERSTVMDKELRLKFLAATGADEAVTDDVLLSRVAVELEARRADAEKAGQLSADLELSRTTIATLEGERDQAITLSRTSTAPTLDPELVAERSLRISEKLDTLIGQGYTKAGVDKLKTVLLGREDSPNIIALSRVGGSRGCFADEIFNVLVECKPGPVPGTRTGIQTLSRAADTGAAPAKAINPWTGKEVTMPVSPLA